jgi:argininosuccinate synthase
MDLRRMPPARRVALAYSGGLDSILCLRLLRDHYGAPDVVLVLVDVGQGEQDLEHAARKVANLGARLVVVDARTEFVDEWVALAIMANGRYGEYPVSSSMTRQLIASKLAGLALREGCDAVAEGSSGKGNDQFRFHNVFTYLAPQLRVIAPVRDLNLSRRDERSLAREYGLEFYAGISDDKTSWGRALGSGEIDSLDLPVPREEFYWWVPQDESPDEGAVYELELCRGVPVRLNELTGLEAIVRELNESGGRHSIGRIDTIEDGIMGLKSREVYEAPAATILLTLHRDLERLCLTGDELRFKALVDARWAELVYRGAWFHPLKADLDAFIARSQEAVSGAVTFRLRKGVIEIVRRRSELGLFDPRVRSLELDSFDQRHVSGAVEVAGLEFAALHARGLHAPPAP